MTMCIEHDAAEEHDERTEVRQPALHIDDIAVNCFTQVMRDKLASLRSEGAEGWHDPENCTVESLAHLLIESVAKGDPVDVANYCMMLHQRGAPASVLADAVIAKAEPIGYELQVTNGWVRIEADKVAYFQRHGRKIRKLYTHPLPFMVAELHTRRPAAVVTVSHQACRRAHAERRCTDWCGDTACSPDMQRIPEDIERRSPNSVEMRVMTASLGSIERGEQPAAPRAINVWDRRESRDRRKR